MGGLLIIVITINNLKTIIIIVQVKNFLNLVLLGVNSFNPAIIGVSLEVVCVILVELLQICNSFLAWDTSGHQELFIRRQILVSVVGSCCLPLPCSALCAEMITSKDKFLGCQYTFLKELAVFEGSLEIGNDAGGRLVNRIFSLLY